MYILASALVIQKRGGNEGIKENFERTWDEYKNGFGDREEEFWLGNDQIHQLTKSGDMKLRVELEAHNGSTAWAEYNTFRWRERLIGVYFTTRRSI